MTANKLSKATNYLLIGLGFFIFTALAWYPYIPREGDAFSCWFSYANDLRSGGLSEALRYADATGRYPGYAFFIFITEWLLSSNFLDSLFYLRIIFINLSFIALILLFCKFKVSLTRAILYSLAILLVPTARVSINLNTQDSFKCFALFVSLIAFTDVFEGLKAKKTSAAQYIFLGFSSILLSSVRGPEILPYYSFALLLIFSSKKIVLPEKIRATFLCIAPSFLFLFGLHLYGKLTVGTWSVSSSGGAPQIWLRLARRHILNTPIPWVEKLTLFTKLMADNFLNKTGYFIENYFFEKGSFIMLDVDKFYPGLQNPTNFKVFFIFPLSILASGLLVFAFIKWRKESLLTPLIGALATSAGFYLYGLNHYEPRYWLVVFTLFGIVLSLLIERFRLKFVSLSFIVAIIALEIYLSYSSFFELSTWNTHTNLQAKIWQREAMKYCSDRSFDSLIIPDNYYRFSSFRYHVNESCPRLMVYRSFAFIFPMNLKNPVILDEKYFEDTYLEASKGL